MALASPYALTSGDDIFAFASGTNSVAGTAAAWFALRPRASEAIAATLPGAASPHPLYANLYAPGTTLLLAPAVACGLYLAATVLGVYKPGRARRRMR